MRHPVIYTIALIMLMTSAVRGVYAQDLGESGFADSNGVKIHYQTMGEGPLVVMIHGFPDYWYTWRNQMPVLAEKFKVVAIDQRGYNQSDQPEGVENYTTDKLVSDVHAVVKHLGRERATIIGHDWGGIVAWTFAMQHPEMTERLVILNLPHPWGLQRELANNPQQQKNSQYARNFQMPGSHKFLTAEGLSTWVKDEDARKFYTEAFKRSSFEAMLNYYKANYPKQPYQEPVGDPPKVQCSTLVIHGLGDMYLLASGLNETWNWIEKDLTIVTVPGAEHFVQHDKPEFVSKTIMQWLSRD